MDQATLIASFELYRSRLYHLVEQRMHPLLLQRLSVEDVLQEALCLILQKRDFFESEQAVPLYFKFRLILLQTLTALERTHLHAQKRNLNKECSLDQPFVNSDGDRAERLQFLPATISSPLTKVARLDRHALLLKTIETLHSTDSQILILRHFDGCSNQEAASILGVTEKAASIRYVRALKHLQEKLLTLSEFV